MNRELERLIQHGVARNVFYYFENKCMYMMIAQNSQKIERDESRALYSSVQNNALMFMYLCCYNIYDKNRDSASLHNVCNFMHGNSKKLKIHCMNACDEFINGTYDVQRAPIYEMDGSIISKDKTNSFVSRIKTYIPTKENYELYKKFARIDSFRSKRIAHTDKQMNITPATFADLQLFADNAVMILNAISQVYFGVLCLTEQMEPSVVIDAEKPIRDCLIRHSGFSNNVA